MRAQPNWRRLSWVVPSRRLNRSIWVTSTARSASPSIAQFICLLSKVAVVSAVAVSLRHSTAATIRHSAKEVNAIDCPTGTLPKTCWPTSIMDSRPMVTASPVRPTVISIPLVSTD